MKHSLTQRQVGQGKNALAIRQQNELAVLSYIRTHKEASRLELAKSLGVTSQAIAAISKNLIENQLIKKVRKHYTKIAGQPPSIYQLDPQGAYSMGISIGRSQSRSMLIDFCGGIVHSDDFDYKYPDPDKILQYTVNSYKSIISSLPKAKQDRIIGVGVSMPYYIHLWDRELNYPDELMRKWETYNMPQLINERIKMPIILENDASASAIGEVLFGNMQGLNSFFYVYIGTFPGGSLIMNGKLVPGSNNNAGSIGSMLIPASKLLNNDNNQGNQGNEGNGGMVQFLHRTGLHSLRKYLEQQGIHFDNFTELFNALEKDKSIYDDVYKWLDDAAEAIAYVTISTNALLDFKAVVIDAAMPDFWIKTMIERSKHHYDLLESRGIIKPSFHQGKHHADARCLGSATLPLYDIFAKI